MSRVEHLAEGVTLYLGDCREILPTLGKVDAVVTDPPYGVNVGIDRHRLPPHIRSAEPAEQLGWEEMWSQPFKRPELI
jgi:tRNA G10  N-methylase Trm11